MIRLCKNLFYKPKYGSDADSMMLKRLFSTVTTILVCLAAITFSAYAFFSGSVTSATNTLQASNFATTVTIQGSDEGIITQGKIQKHIFSPGTYTVTITADDNTTGTGFCVITASGTTYYTQQLGVDLNAADGKRTEVRFQLDVKAAAKVVFDAHWGTNSLYNTSNGENEFYITNSDPLRVVVINATHTITDDPGETESKENESESEPEDVTESTTESATQDATTPTVDSGERVHIVQDGENLDSIAKQYGTTYSSLADYNNIDDPRIIQPGQEICIPTAEEEMPEATTSPETTPETSNPTEQTEPAETVTTLPEETQPAVETTDAPIQ